MIGCKKPLPYDVKKGLTFAIPVAVDGLYIRLVMEQHQQDQPIAIAVTLTSIAPFQSANYATIDGDEYP